MARGVCTISGQGCVYTATFPSSALAHTSLPSPLGSWTPAYVHAWQAQLHQLVSHGYREGQFLGWDGWDVITQEGNEAHGP